MDSFVDCVTAVLHGISLSSTTSIVARLSRLPTLHVDLFNGRLAVSRHFSEHRELVS